MSPLTLLELTFRCDSHKSTVRLRVVLLVFIYRRQIFKNCNNFVTLKNGSNTTHIYTLEYNNGVYIFPEKTAAL